MKNKRVNIIIILIISFVIAALVFRESNEIDYRTKDMVVQSLNSAEGIVIKDVRSSNEIDYFFLETGEKISSILDNIEWTLCEDDIEMIQEIPYPYMDIRIAEGYDVVIVYTGDIYVQNIYGSKMMKKEKKYTSSLSFFYLENYIRNNSSEYDENKVTNEMFAH